MGSNNASGSIDYVEKVSRLLASDMYRMRCLTALRELALPQGYIGAGFLRNAIWDALHNKPSSTPLNDVDVIYFCRQSEKERDAELERRLHDIMPEANWQVKNQVRMHTLHGHNPYESCEQAISYWIEKETCVAVKLNELGCVEVLAPFGLQANFASTLSINPRYPRREIFNTRVKQKDWLKIWPQLTLHY
ncbi:nitrate reductase [Tenacibaculum sp. KUL152]|nr:nitrate reductase [Tenacibaculum sp. KUL152]